jgi:adenylate cyclase
MAFLKRVLPSFTLRSAIFAFIVIFLVLVGMLLGLFEPLELKAIDNAFNLRGANDPIPAVDGAGNPRLDSSGKPESLIVIVAIDDESIRETNLQWPWPRSYEAQLISAIAASQPKSITTDIFWYEPGLDTGGDTALAQAIAKAGNVILANDINRVTGPGFDYEELRAPLPDLRAGALNVGIANLDRDTDGFVRSMPFYRLSQSNGQAYFSWAAYTYFNYLGVPPPSSIGAEPLPVGDRTVPLENGLLRVNYLGAPGLVFDQVPAYQVVNGDIYQRLGADFFKDKIVLLGATTESLHDTYPVPFKGDIQPMPGVEINAHVINTLLTQRYISRWNIGVGLLVTLILGVLAYFFSTIPQPFLSLGLTGLTALVYLAFWAMAFTQFRTEVFVVAPLTCFVLGYAVPSVERALSEQLEKRKVRGIFERFVSPQMVEQMIERGLEGARGQRTELTILFSDIRGFTTMSENLSPDQVVDLLNEYLGVMTDVILKHGGTIDKYEGDLIMAFFNAPLPQVDHAKRAVDAAIDMRVTLDTLKAKWARDKSRPTNFEMGIGLNTGDAFVGLLGSEKRINYTCIGDSVNLASRVQDLTKDLHWPLLITEFTYAIVKEHFDCEFAEARLVKGKTQPVGMYRVLGRKGAPESERIRPLFA